MKILLSLLLLLSFVTLAEPQELYWEDLIPTDFVLPEQQVDHDGSKNQQQSPYAPVVNELDGKLVKIPGFVVPLEGENQLLTEFLLVPFFGACIHVPPPPANQIVYVTFDTAAEIPSMYDPIWIVGTLSTKEWKGDIATVGYRLSGIQVLPYEG
ncbi:DUF3299 domain-containing protein [Alteromonadaceae bacterium BrNp21-10]|nr:DUF3299 domain-containing protein [Alteromonadaceae bacterium BrNp21-10]